MIDSVLSHTSLKMGIEPQLTSIALDAFLREIEVDAAIEAHGRKITTVVSVPAGLKIDADPRLLRSAVSNLLQNALKFSHEDSTVSVTAARADGRVTIEVVDACGGLPPGKAAELFSPLVQRARTGEASVSVWPSRCRRPRRTRNHPGARHARRRLRVHHRSSERRALSAGGGAAATLTAAARRDIWPSCPPTRPRAVPLPVTSTVRFAPRAATRCSCRLVVLADRGGGLGFFGRKALSRRVRAGAGDRRWSVGTTQSVELTLVRDDRRNLSCASDQVISGLHCAYRRDARQAGPAAADDPQILQPYNTVGNELLLGPASGPPPR